MVWMKNNGHPTSRWGKNFNKEVLYVPPFDTTVSTSCPIMHDIRSIEIEKGILRIKLSNYTHIKFDSLIIQHLRTGNIDITVPFAPINPMDSVSTTVRINNKRVADSIACSLHLIKLYPQRKYPFVDMILL